MTMDISTNNGNVMTYGEFQKEEQILTERELERIELQKKYTFQKNGRLVYTYDESGRNICGALNRKGLYCIKSPVHGRNRCKLHGGESPRGVASPSYKTGKFSTDLPSRLSERYMKALDDPELLSLRDDIAIYEARIAELMSKLDNGESRKRWEDLSEAFYKFKKASANNEPKDAAKAFDDMNSIIRAAKADYNNWDEMSRTMQAKRRTVESEQKRLVMVEQTITVAQAMALVSFVVGVIKEEVSDPKALTKIVSKISKFIETSKQLSSGEAR